MLPLPVRRGSVFLGGYFPWGDLFLLETAPPTFILGVGELFYGVSPQVLDLICHNYKVG